MELKDLITEKQAKGAISIEQAKYKPLANEPEWWTVRAFVIASDKDRQFAEYPLDYTIKKRNN